MVLFHAALTTNNVQVSLIMTSRLEELIVASHVMLFMKGTPDVPRCGFSRKTVALLREHNIQFGSFDILGDQEVCMFPSVLHFVNLFSL